MRISNLIAWKKITIIWVPTTGVPLGVRLVKVKGLGRNRHR